jgi:hypothetical protein
MKVTFQQTVEMGEVPGKIEIIYGECIERIKTLSLMSLENSAYVPQKFIDRIESLRRNMVEIDTSLEECNILMKGFIAARQTMETIPQEEVKAVVEGYPPIPSEISDLEEE